VIIPLSSYYLEPELESNRFKCRCNNLEDADSMTPVYIEAKWNRSKTCTNRPCVYTRTLGTVPCGTAIRALFGSAEGMVPFATVPFGSSVNKQNQEELSQKRIDMKRGYSTLVCRLTRDDSFVCFITFL